MLGLVVGISLPNGRSPSRLIRAVRAFLDFYYLAQYSSHTTASLKDLDAALKRFHDNVSIFIDLGIREHFNFPKMHSLLHYASCISFFGATDNYNTEQSERLHIDFTKSAYRATNHRDELPQMTTWLERREKVEHHASLIQRRLRSQPGSSAVVQPPGIPQAATLYVKMAKKPSIQSVSFTDLANNYGALYFQDSLADFIAQRNHPNASAASVRACSRDMLFMFRSVAIFHKIKFVKDQPDSSNSKLGHETVDCIHARPEQNDPGGRFIPRRFDTALIRVNSHNNGLRGM